MKLHPQNPLPDPAPKTGLEFLPNDALIMKALALLLANQSYRKDHNEMVITQWELEHRSKS